MNIFLDLCGAGPAHCHSDLAAKYDNCTHLASNLTKCCCLASHYLGSHHPPPVRKSSLYQCFLPSAPTEHVNNAGLCQGQPLPPAEPDLLVGFLAVVCPPQYAHFSELLISSPTIFRRVLAFLLLLVQDRLQRALVLTPLSILAKVLCPVSLEGPPLLINPPQLTLCSSHLIHHPQNPGPR